MEEDIDAPVFAGLTPRSMRAMSRGDSTTAGGRMPLDDEMISDPLTAAATSTTTTSAGTDLRDESADAMAAGAALADDGWMPKTARLHSGKTRTCVVCCAPLQYTTLSSWDEYLQSEEYLLSLQSNLLNDTFISGLICGDSVGGDLPTEHRMHKNRKTKCRQSVHDYLNMTSAGVIDPVGKEKASIRTLEEMLITALPTPVFTHVLERRLAVISHSSEIACQLMKSRRVFRMNRAVVPGGSDVELHHLAIHTLAALLQSFDYANANAMQSFEEMSRLLTCFPVLSLFSFWSPPKQQPERALPVTKDMVEASSSMTTPRNHAAEFAVDESTSTYWQSLPRPGVTSFTVHHPNASFVSSISIRWHLKCFPQRVAIQYRITGSSTFVQLMEQATAPPEHFITRFPANCDAIRIVMTGIPVTNRNALYAIEQLSLHTPSPNTLFVDPKTTIIDVAKWLLGALSSRNEDIIVEAIGALKAWALATASLGATLLFLQMLLSFEGKYSVSSNLGIGRFALDQAYLLYEGIKAYRNDEICRQTRGDGNKKSNESRKVRALFEGPVCSAGVTIEDGGLAVRTRETSYQYAAVNVGISSGKASWKFRLDNDTVDDEMTCFGAAILPVTVSGYDSSPNLWMLRGYNGNLYARGHKLSRSIGKVHPGDIVQIDVDMSDGTLAFKINDTDYGVVFTDLGGHEIFPAVSFYGSGKVITLLDVYKWDDQDSGNTDIDPLYLSNLKEYYFSVGYGTLGKGGHLGYASDAESRTPSTTATPASLIQINGEKKQRSLSTHPPARGDAFVIYDLAGAYDRFVGAVAINDDVSNDILQQRAVSVVYSISGDGALLWQSKPLAERRAIERFELSVRNVRMLELKVTCPGSNHFAHTVWIDPCVYPLEEWTCLECSLVNKGSHQTCVVCKVGSRESGINDNMQVKNSCDNEAAQQFEALADKQGEFDRQTLYESDIPFHEIGTMIVRELCELTAIKASNLIGNNSFPFEEPFCRQPSKDVFRAFLSMLQTCRQELQNRQPEKRSERQANLDSQRCLHTVGLIRANFACFDSYDVSPVNDMGISIEIITNLRLELEMIANVQDDIDVHSLFPTAVQIAAAETIITGIPVLYSAPDQKIDLLLRLLRNNAAARYNEESSRFFILTSLLHMLSRPGQDGILTFFPVENEDIDYDVIDLLSDSAVSCMEGVKEAICLLIELVSDNKSYGSFIAQSNESNELAKGAMMLLKTYQLYLLAGAVEQTKKTTLNDSDENEVTILDHKQQHQNRIFLQETVLQFGSLLLNACRHLAEELVVDQTEQSFLGTKSEFSCAESSTVPLLSELLPWFISCSCLLRRQHWLARTSLPAVTRLLGVLDHYCSELDIVNNSDGRLRKLEMHIKARAIESQEMERMVAVDKSLGVHHQSTKQMYNVFKHLYTGDKDHFDGQIGFQFEATSTFHIVALGRSVNPVKNGGRLIRQHTVRLWEEATQTLIAYVSVSGSSRKDELGYAVETLSAPAKLTQGKLYRLTTQEYANGGDPWYKKENLPDEEYDSSYIKILRDCYASGSPGFPNSQNLSGAAYGVPTFLVEGKNPLDSIPRFVPRHGSFGVKFNVKRKSNSVLVSHSGTSVQVVGESDTWRSCFLQTSVIQGVHAFDFIVKSIRTGGMVSGHLCVGVDWNMSANGVNSTSSSYETFLGKSNTSIGWMPSIGTLWIQGQKVPYGDKLMLSSGDLLTLVVDYDLQTISFTYNGREMGIAVRAPQLQAYSLELKTLPDALAPGVSIFGPHDVVQIRPAGIAQSTLRIHWLFDLHNSIASLAGRLASTLIAGHPVDGVEEELLPWLQSPLLSGGILEDLPMIGASDRRESITQSWSNSLRLEYQKYPSVDQVSSINMLPEPSGGFGEDGIDIGGASKRGSRTDEIESALRDTDFFSNLIRDMSDDGPAQVILYWLEKHSPDRSFLSRLGRFPICERLTCAALVKHAPAHVIHEVQAIIAGAEHAKSIGDTTFFDNSNLVPSEDLHLVWSHVITLRHWLIKTRQEYRAKEADESPSKPIDQTVKSFDASGETIPAKRKISDVIDLHEKIAVPKTFDELLNQVCERAEFLCLLAPPSEERDRLGVSSQIALSNLAEKWSAQKTPPSLQPMVERWKSLSKSDLSKWSGIVDVLRAQHRWRKRRTSISAQSMEGMPSNNASINVGENSSDNPAKKVYHYKDSFAAMMKACDLYVRTGIGAPPEVLQALLERRQKRSESRLFGLQAMKNILSLLSYDSARHNVIIFLRPALRGFTDDEKESRELNDGQTIAETFRATVRHHYLKGLEGCNRPTIDKVQRAFCDLYSYLAQLLSGDMPMDSQLKQAVLCAWSLDFEPRDHPFLLKSGIITILHDIFSVNSIRSESSEDGKYMKALAKGYHSNPLEPGTIAYTNMNWYPLSEQFVQQSALHSGYVTKRDILRLILRSPPFACSRSWWRNNVLSSALEENMSPIARQTASSMSLMYSELLRNLQSKLSWCCMHFLDRKVLQFGMSSSSGSHGPTNPAKPEEISCVETPALGEVDDFTIEIWVYPVELSGYCCLRSDNGLQTGSVHLEFVDRHLQLSVMGNYPREHLFTSFRFQTHVWTHIALSYKGSERCVQFFANGKLAVESKYERVCEKIHLRAARFGSWINNVDAQGNPVTNGCAQRAFKGSIAEARIWRVARRQEQISRDFERAVPYEIESESTSSSGLLALWHFNEGEGVCGYDRISSSLKARMEDNTAENGEHHSNISFCHWAKMNIPVLSHPSVDSMDQFQWIKLRKGIIQFQRVIRAAFSRRYIACVKSSRLVCEYDESLIKRLHWDQCDSDEDDQDVEDCTSDPENLVELDSDLDPSDGLDSSSKALLKIWSANTDEHILIKKQTRKCAWIVFRFLSTVGIGGIHERREGEAISAAATAKLKRKQRLYQHLGSDSPRSMLSPIGRGSELSYDEEDVRTRTAEAASDAAKSAATNRKLEEPVLQTLWFSMEFHRKIFEVIEKELCLATELTQETEGLTRGQRMPRSMSTPLKQRGGTLRTTPSGIDPKRSHQKMIFAASSIGEVHGDRLEPLEVEMFMFKLLLFMFSESREPRALEHLARPRVLRELLQLLRLASPRCQRVVKLLLRSLCGRGVVKPTDICAILGSESVFVDLLLDQVAESVCSTAAPLAAHSTNVLPSVSNDSAAISESLSNPMGYRSGQIYLVLASESVALLRLLLTNNNWKDRVAELLCSAIRNIAPMVLRQYSEGVAPSNTKKESSDLRVRAAIVRAVGALCVLGSHSDCIRVGGKVSVTSKESVAEESGGTTHALDHGEGSVLATLIELNARSSTVRVVLNPSSDEYDPSHNVQEVSLSALSPIEEVRLPSNVIPLTMDMIPVILQLSSLEKSSLMRSFDDLWHMQIRSRALLALESILRHSIHVAKDIVREAMSQSLLMTALSPCGLNNFVSLPFLQERGRIILCRLIEASTPLGSAMFHGLEDPKVPTLSDAEDTTKISLEANNDPAVEETEEYRVRRGFASTLAAMGFEFELCMVALENSRDDPNLAVEWLMGVGAAAYQERQRAQRLRAASLEGRRSSNSSGGDDQQSLRSKAEELESISGMPFCLALCALDLSNGDPNRAMEWLMEHGSRYMDKADAIVLLTDDFVSKQTLSLEDRAALEDIDQPDLLVTASSAVSVSLISSSGNDDGGENSQVSALSLAPILAPLPTKKPAAPKSTRSLAQAPLPGFAALDPNYLTPHILLTVVSGLGSVQNIAGNSRTGTYRRFSPDDGILITFLNTETGAFEDEWHDAKDVRRITKIYDEEVVDVSSIHRVAVRTENALSTHYARRAVIASLAAYESSQTYDVERNSEQLEASFSDTILDAVGGARQFVSLLKLVAVSDPTFSSAPEQWILRRDRQQRYLSTNSGSKSYRHGSMNKRHADESAPLLQNLQEIMLDILQEEARSGKLQSADWLWMKSGKKNIQVHQQIPATTDSANVIEYTSRPDMSHLSVIDDAEFDDELNQAIALSMQDSVDPLMLSGRSAESYEETRTDNADQVLQNDLPADRSLLRSIRQPSYTEAQEVAEAYFGGVDKHDGLLSSVLVKECVSHFVESTRVAGEGASSKTTSSPTVISEYQSLHPYFGRCEYVRAVTTDPSIRSVRIVFDQRCKLGPKTKLSIFSDAECEHRIGGIDHTDTAGALPDLLVHSHQFWFRFIAAEDDPVKDHGYGYRFQVKPMASICWSNENEVLVNPSLEWACWVLEFLLNEAGELVRRGAVHNRKIYGALVRYLRSPGAPFKSRVTRLLLQLLHQPELFPPTEIPDLESLESIGKLAIARAKTEKETGKVFIAANLLQLVELSVMTMHSASVFEKSLHPVLRLDVPRVEGPLQLPVPADRRDVFDCLNDVSVITRFMLGETDTLHKNILTSVWLDVYGSATNIESRHPYAMDSTVSGRLQFDGAQSLLVTFDARCATNPSAVLELCSIVRITTTHPNVNVHSNHQDEEPETTEQRTVKTYSGSDAWTGTVELPGSILEYSFTADENAHALYGISLSVSAVGMSKEKQLTRALPRKLESMLDKMLWFQSPAKRLQADEPRHWTPAMDAQLVDWVNIYAETSGIASIEVKPADVRLDPTLDGLRCSLLLDLPREEIQLRFGFFKYFNQCLKECLSLLDLRDTHSPWMIAHKLRCLSYCIFFDLKNTLIEAAIDATTVSGDTNNSNNSTARITLDRLQALESRDDREVEPSISECFFAQAFRQLNQVDPTVFRRKIDSKGRLFSVKFRGEEGVDWGGVYREGANSMVDDLFCAHFNLFVLCPNGQHDTGANRAMYLPNPKCVSPVAIQMYEFVGKLLGISLRTRGDFPFAFPSLVWKQLINEPLERIDLEGTDAMFVQMLDGIQNCERDGIFTEEEFDAAFEGLDLKFTAFDCNGHEVELVEGGKSQRVTFHNRLEYCQLAEHYRLHEGALQVAAMVRGLSTVFPVRVLTLLTCSEMEILTCGSPKIDVTLWKKHTRYDGYNETDDTVQLFWEAMASFSDEQRSDFVRFAWGRSRLPRGKWPQPFKLTKKGGRDSTQSLPVAHTCFFSVELPPYTSMEQMRSMLLATINFGLGGILMA